MSGKFALVFGNTQYADPALAQLTAPGKDAEDLARVLKEPGLCAFDEVAVYLNELSSSAIEAIDAFFDDRKPDDLLVLYFSGHGIRDELGSLYLAFRNTIRSRLRSTALKAEYVREAMDESRSKRQVLILDCCNSGAFPPGAKAELGGAMGMAVALQGYGRYVLTASDATQFAWEGDRLIGETSNSLFTHFLVKGLEGDADRDGDGTISVDDLYDYAFGQVSRLTPNQTPTKSASIQEGEIVLRQITRLEDIKPVSLPDELVEAMGDERTFVRESAVQQLARLLQGKNLGLARSAREALQKISDQDDSLRVRKAASDALAPILAADQQAQEEHLASQQTEADERAQLKGQEELAARQQAAEEQRAHEKVEAKQPGGMNSFALPAQPEPQEARPARENIQSKVRPQWISVLWIAVGCAFSGAVLSVVSMAVGLYSTIDAVLLLVVFGLCIGSTIALVLLFDHAVTRGSRLLAILFSWAIGWAVTGAILSHAIAGAATVDFVRIWALGWLIGSFATAANLRAEGAVRGWVPVFWITLAWTLGGAIDAYIAWTGSSNLIVLLAIGGAVTGTLGGAVMMWLMRNAGDTSLRA